MKTCPGCATTTADDATTCVVCGTPLVDVAPGMVTGRDHEDSTMTTDTDHDAATDPATQWPAGPAAAGDAATPSTGTAVAAAGPDAIVAPDDADPSFADADTPASTPDASVGGDAAVATGPTDEVVGSAGGPSLPPPPVSDVGAGPTGDEPAWPVVPASPTASRPTPPNQGAVLVSESARNWALLAHVSGIVASSVGGMGFLGPLLVWLLKRDEDPFIAQNASEALNFQLSMLLYGILLVVASLPVITLIATIPLAIVGFILWLVLPIVAAIRASRGEAYTYPITIGFVQP